MQGLHRLVGGMVGWLVRPLAVGTGSTNWPLLGLCLECCPLPPLGLVVNGAGQRLQGPWVPPVTHGCPQRGEKTGVV